MKRFRFRDIVPIVKAAGLGWATGAFIVIFVVCSLIVAAVEPRIDTIPDAMWLCFQTVTTIGFGDEVVSTAFGRFIVVVLSILSVFYLAVITGAVVSWCQESMRARRGKSVARFIDSLTHLEELSKEELAELSAEIRAMKG